MGKLLAAFFSLPMIPWLLILGGAALILKSPRTGFLLVLGGLLLMYLVSTPAIVYPLAMLWQGHPRSWSPTSAQAIVVLGAGREPVPEYGNRYSLTCFGEQRLHYAAWLAHRTQLPILLSGGGATSDLEVSEGRIMQHVLEVDYGLKARWLEQASENTWENARNTARILKPLAIKKVYLVTQAWHMKRAKWAFQQAGLDPIAAPAGYLLPSSARQGIVAWIPDTRAQMAAALIWHEVLGYIWYRLRYGHD